MNRKINLQNFAIFPCCKNSKIPATQHGFKDAKFNLDTEMLLNNGFNIAVACEMSNLIVIDADVHGDPNDYNGIDELDDLVTKLGPLPENCFTVCTPNNGIHIYASSYGITRPKGKIGKFIDVKHKGYCLLPPSSVNGKSYKILEGINEDGVPIIKPLPKAWIDFINKPSSESENAFKHKSLKAQSKQVLDSELKTMCSKCKFIEHCILESQSLEEPLWFALGSILSNFSNGFELFDYFSQPYPGYTKEATRKKYENASKYNFNCNTISGIFDGCSQCMKGRQYGK